MGDVLIALAVLASWVLCYCLGWSDRGLYEAERAIERRFDRLIRRVSVSEDASDGE